VSASVSLSDGIEWDTEIEEEDKDDSQGVLQDGDVGDSALPLFNSGRSGRDEAERDGGGDGGDGELHYELESKGCCLVNECGRSVEVDVGKRRVDGEERKRKYDGEGV
jgi:hypothetical protein